MAFYLEKKGEVFLQKWVLCSFWSAHLAHDVKEKENQTKVRDRERERERKEKSKRKERWRKKNIREEKGKCQKAWEEAGGHMARVAVENSIQLVIVKREKDNYLKSDKNLLSIFTPDVAWHGSLSWDECVCIMKYFYITEFSLV